MAPILSKFVKCKTGRKIPINESNVRAVVNLAIKTTPKRPTKYFPRPGEDRDSDSELENDRELQELLADCPQSAHSIPNSSPNSDPNPNSDPSSSPNSSPNPNPNQPGSSRQDENPPESIFIDGLDPVLEPNMTLKDITPGQRAQILCYPGSDKEKRRIFFMENYMDYYRYYELFDCWNECFITSKFTFNDVIIT